MPKQQESFFKETVRFALITLAIVLPIRFFIAEPFIVSGASMEPTFYTSDYLVVDQVTYRFESPQRGDVIIFRYPFNPSKYYIKRIVGLPGETVEVADEKTTIKNKRHPDGFEIEEPYILQLKGQNFTKTLSSTEYFVMGDNRAASSDSRSWGPLEEKFIVGRAIFQLTPFNKIRVFPGTARPLFEQTS